MIVSLICSITFLVRVSIMQTKDADTIAGQKKVIEWLKHPHKQTGMVERNDTGKTRVQLTQDNYKAGADMHFSELTIMDSVGSALEITGSKMIVYDSLRAIKVLLWQERYYMDNPVILILDKDTIQVPWGDTLRGSRASNSIDRFTSVPYETISGKLTLAEWVAFNAKAHAQDTFELYRYSGGLLIMSPSADKFWNDQARWWMHK